MYFLAKQNFGSITICSISAILIRLAWGALQPADSIYILDATITDSAECSCQKEGAKYMAKYSLSQPYLIKLGLIAYAENSVLLYRLAWPINITHWNQAVDTMKCVGGSTPRIDKAFSLAYQMFSKAGRPNSYKTVGITVSKKPTVGYISPINMLFLLSTKVFAGAILSSSLTLADLTPLATQNPIISGTSFCASLTALKAAYPL